MDFQPNRLQVYTRQALIAEIKRVVAESLDGLCPTHREFNQFSRVHSTTLVKEFGSWAEAMHAAGFEYSRSRVRRIEVEDDSGKITADLLLKELKSIAHKHNGRIFQYEDYRKLGGKRARGTFCKYLGGWRQAVANIGLKDGFGRPRPDLRTYVDEDYFAEMQRLWEMLGRQPKAREMKDHGRISPQSFQQRFGSWMGAVHRFCQDRGGPDGGHFINGAHQDERVDQTHGAKQIESQAPDAALQAKPAGPKKRTPGSPRFGFASVSFSVTISHAALVDAALRKKSGLRLRLIMSSHGLTAGKRLSRTFRLFVSSVIRASQTCEIAEAVSEARRWL